MKNYLISAKYLTDSHKIYNNKVIILDNQEAIYKSNQALIL